MAASPARFLFGFFFVAILLWIVFIVVAWLLALLLSRIMGASVRFRVGGWKCLRDVVVKFKKGAVESISVGEIRLSLRQSLANIGLGFLSKEPKLQVLICDLEVVLRPTLKGKQKSRPRKSRSSGSGSSGRGKWMIVANVARFLSVSVSDLALKTPKATLEIKEFRVDICKDGSSSSNLFFKLFVSAIAAYMGEEQDSIDQASNGDDGRGVLVSQISLTEERTSSLFNCEELSLSCEFGHDRESGVAMKDLDITCGGIMMNLNEKMLLKSGGPSRKVSDTVTESAVDPIDQSTAVDSQKKQGLLNKYSTLFPEKASLSLPMLGVKFVHQEHGLFVENQIMGVQLKSFRSRSSEDGGENTKLDFQLDLSEIHLFRESDTSVLEVLKVNVSSSVYVPIQATSVVRAEIDVRLGGTQCNVILSRLKHWMSLQTMEKKKMVLKEDSLKVERPKSTGSKAIMWTCTVSAPEMTIVLYSISGLPLFHGCSQSSHVFANNVSSTGTTVHTELGELNLHLSDEYQECSKESLFGMEANSGSLLHIAKVGLDWGGRDVETVKDKEMKSGPVLSVDMTGMAIYFTMKRMESLIATAMSLQALLKSFPRSKNKVQRREARSSKSPGKGTQLEVNLERCSINFSGDVGLENTVLEDPKRVNYGSEGGRVLISVSADGTKRTADIISTVSDKCKDLKYSVSLEIFHFTFCMNKEDDSVQLELERARSIYQEHPEEPSLGTKVLLLDMQNAKFVRRSAGLKEIAVCSYFSATDIAVRWEPDVHISLFELMLRMKLLLQHHKPKAHYENPDSDSATSKVAKEPVKGPGYAEPKQKKKESVLAVDVEMLRISAEAGDGVEATLQVQSIFSENARIGVLLEGLMLCFDGCRVFKSSRMQISRIPNALSGPETTVWDWVVQGLDVHICMPYRLQLRAIDDAVEDQLRALKLMTSAKNLIFPIKKNNPKPKRSSSSFGCLKFHIRKLTADIEEEPLQGWLDEHYQLMKNEACELAVRLKFLEDLVKSGDNCLVASDNSETVHEKKIVYKGVDVDLHDPCAISRLREDIYRESFRSYYQACQNLRPYEGSGAWREGFQAGFRPSTARASLFSVFATDLDLSLMNIEGGEAGMVNVVKELDPVARENNIPFSRLYGSKIDLQTSTLVAQLRNYTFPLLSATHGKCEGRLVLAQQATVFQPQIHQEVFVGKWRKVRLLRSASGTTPPLKTYTDLPLHFQKGEVSYGVGYEPMLTDVSYAFTVALRRANLSVKNPDVPPPPPKKEKSLPWWDEMRSYIHGRISLFFSESEWNILATTDPYEKLDKLRILSGRMEIQQSDGLVHVSAKDFKVFTSSLECLARNRNLKFPPGVCYPFLDVPWFTLDVNMDWDCDSGNPMNHYLFATPSEGRAREHVFDPFRSTSLSLRWNFSFRPLQMSERLPQSSGSGDSAVPDKGLGGIYPLEGRPPVVKAGAHDLEWIIKFWGMNYLPPHKLRSFSRWPRFGVPRISRSGNLSLDRVMTEFMLRVDSTPVCIKNIPLDDDDPAKGLTFNMTKLKFELVNSRGRQKYTFESKREPLDQVYQGLDLHVPKVHLDRDDRTSVAKLVQMTRKNSQLNSLDRGTTLKCNSRGACTDRQRDDGFLLSSDYFTIRKQSPKADPARLLAWQEAGRKNLEMTYVRSEFENGSESDEHMRSDPSDDDGFNVVIADSCQRIFVYGLKLLWNIENRDAVWSWVGALSKAFSPPKPSPSRQYTQRKILEENQKSDGLEKAQDDTSKLSPDAINGNSLNQVTSQSSEPKSSSATGNSSGNPNDDGSTNESEEGTRHFMVNVVEPQFNLHSEEASGRFLLAAVSGRVLARSFHSVLHVGQELIEKALGSGTVQIRDSQPEMTWKRMEISAMLEHVQAHVAPTDVDPGAGLQWLPKIRRSSPKVKRTGALLERVFMPCDMYFRYTRHKGGTPDLKVKPLKELTFNSHNITATMTSRQFQVMLDVLTNLLFARTPKPRRSTLLHPAEDDADVEQEADEVVPDGVEEVELARVGLEQKERELKLLLHDIRKLSLRHDIPGDHGPEQAVLWMVTSGRSTLVQRLRNELGHVQKSRKAASASLRMALQKAAELRLMEKEKNKSPSYAMRISLQINKVVWSMLVDGKAFAEAEINDMIYDFDRDYKDIGVARFTIKSFVVRDCFPNTKSDMLLCAWNPPPEWGKKVMLRIDAKQGAPKDGRSPIELFQVDIYPLKIHLTDLMYRTMWDYLFPEEEQDSQRRQEVWKVSTTAGLKRVKKGSMPEVSGPGAKESEGSSKPITSALAISTDSLQVCKQNQKAGAGSTSQLRRTSSFDRTWEENVAESVTDELMSQETNEDENTKGKAKESKAIKPGRASHEEKKVGKTSDEKRTRPRKMIEFRNVKISQVELQVTFEDLKIPVTDLRLLMDEFHRAEFVGTWKRLFSRIRKHVIWGVLKSVTGMQMKKFKDKAHSQKEIGATSVPDELNLSDSDGGGVEKSEQYPISFLKRPAEGAGDGFVTSVRGLFNTQRRKAKALILRTMRGDQESEIHGEWSENEAEFSPFARQLTITKAKRLIRRHAKKLRSRRGSTQQKDSLPSSPKETTIYESDSSAGSSPYEDFHD